MTDADGDGYGDDNPASGVTAGNDCNDNDCDGSVDPDDAADVSDWYGDADADGFGDVARTTQACEQPEGHVPDTAKCDDSDDATYPGATAVEGDDIRCPRPARPRGVRSRSPGTERRGCLLNTPNTRAHRRE